MPNSTGINRAKIIDLLGLLVRAPRTVDELSELTGMDKGPVRRWLSLLSEERLVRRENISRSVRHYRYFWSPSCTPQD